MIATYRRVAEWWDGRLSPGARDAVGVLLAVGLALLIHRELASLDRGLNLARDGVNFSAEHALTGEAIGRWGQLPSWNAAYLSGMPFQASPQTAGVHWTALLDWLAPNELVAMRLGVLLSLLASAAAGYFMARVWGANRVGALLAALLVAAGGAQLGRLWAGHVSFLLAAPYYPLALGLVRRGLDRDSLPAMLGAGAALGGTMLAGGGWVALNLWLLVGSIGLLLAVVRWRTGGYGWRGLGRVAGLLGTMGLAGNAVAAVKLLPMVAYLPYSSRDTVEYSFAIDRSALSGLGDLATVLLARSRADLDQAGDGAALGHEFTIYVGAIALLLALMGVLWRWEPRTWILLGVAALFAWFSYGANAGVDLYRLLYELIPGYDQVRIPGRMLGGVWMAVTLLAAFGMTALARGRALTAVGLVLVGLVAIDLGGMAGDWTETVELDEYRVYASDAPGELVAGVLELAVTEQGEGIAVELEISNYGNTIWLPADAGQPGGVIATIGYLGTEEMLEIPLATKVDLRARTWVGGGLGPPPPGGAMLMLGMKAHGVRGFDRATPAPLELPLAWVSRDGELRVDAKDPRSRLLPPGLDDWFAFAADLEGRPGRFFVSRYDIYNEADALRDGLEIVGGWDPGHLRHFTNFLGTSMLFTVELDPAASAVPAILNARYVYPHIAPEIAFAGGAEFARIEGLPFAMYELTTARPRGYLAPAAVVLFTPGDAGEAASQLRALVTAQGFDPLAMTVVVVGGDGPRPSLAELRALEPVVAVVVSPDGLDAGQQALLAGLGGAVDVTAAAGAGDATAWIGSLPRTDGKGVEAQVVTGLPGGATFSVDNPSEYSRVLDFAMVWAPGWEVEVDGAKAGLLVVDGAVMGVRLPPGEHEVRFEYHAPGLAAGVALTLAGLVVVAGGGVAALRGSRPA
ncbi:MAG: YfhO family protein [Chloroflexota bacterium]|nr:YfhO family protein [Chloroflexota bacterium]MDP6508576.1 YfhO family protein [Chloroflexota bacterium]MDP6758414.1 YfhO family protein [Chloroflexota bacterium]